jgi:hypothetical protein
MTTQKIFKIRQNFRKLALKLLGLDNLIIQIVHHSGRIEYHDFKNNYITDVLEVARHKKLLALATCQDSKEVNAEVMELFDMSEEEKDKQGYYHWDICIPNDKYQVLLLCKHF